MDDHTALFDEYKLLQQKIDSIGGFKFRVRGWSVTLLSALLVTGKLHDAPPPHAAFLLLAALIVVTGFHMLELEQDRLAQIFGRRAIRLEAAIGSLRRRLRRDPHSTSPLTSPSLATDIRTQSLTARRFRLRIAPYNWFFTIQLLVILAMTGTLLLRHSTQT